jgi:hypothetical protein
VATEDRNHPSVTGLAITGVVLAVIALIAFAVQAIAARPSLRIERAEWPNASSARSFAVARISNAPPPKGLRWVNRAVASRAHVQVRIFRDGIVVQDFKARWSSRPEPFRALMYETGGVRWHLTGSTTAGVPPGEPPMVLSYDQALAVESRTLDLPASSDGEEVPVAIMQAVGEAVVAHAFSSESYAYPRYAMPGRLLEQGNYEVEMTVRSGDRSATRRFRMRVGIEPGNFRLEDTP